MKVLEEMQYRVERPGRALCLTGRGAFARCEAQPRGSYQLATAQTE